MANVIRRFRDDSNLEDTTQARTGSGKETGGIVNRNVQDPGGNLPHGTTKRIVGTYPRGDYSLEIATDGTVYVVKFEPPEDVGYDAGKTYGMSTTPAPTGDKRTMQSLISNINSANIAFHEKRKDRR